jgi:diguanylate cyclase (GGDEF)-like protein
MINSLHTKITIVFIFGLGLIVAIVIFVLSTEVYNNYRALFIQQGRNTAEQLAIKTDKLIQLGLNPNEFLGFDELCQEVVDATEGVILASLNNGQGLSLYSSELTPSQYHATSAEARDYYLEEDDLIIDVPLTGLSQKEYWIQVVVDRKLVYDKVFQLMFKVLSYAGAASVIALVLILWFLKTNLGTPLKQLVAHIRQIDADRATSIEWVLPTRKDEIGIVARAFDKLMGGLLATQSSLSQANRQLLGLTNDLEQQVLLRTTELKAANEQLSVVARTDTLTGLPNRWSFDRALEQRFAHARRFKHSFALLMLDLDGFKKINDLHGHGAGDFALRALGQRFIGAFRTSDSVFRIGGDEFVFLAEEYKDSSDLCLLAEKIKTQVTAPILFENAELELGVLELGVRIGIACLGSEDKTHGELLVRADAAMYRVKKSGGDCLFG